MEIKERLRSPVAADQPGRSQAHSDWHIDPVAARLEVIVGRSRRRSPLRRALRRLGDALERRLDALVPPEPKAGDGETPPVIRFPFF